MGIIPSDAIAEYHTHWGRYGQNATVDAQGNFMSNNPLDYNVGTSVKVFPTQLTRYQSPIDIQNYNGLPQIVINRYDGGFYNGCGQTADPIRMPILRFNFNIPLW